MKSSNLTRTSNPSLEGPYAVYIETIPDEHGGVIKNISGDDMSNDTVTPDVLLQGQTAHNRFGEPIVGTYIGGTTGHCVCFDVEFEDDSTFEVCFKDECCFCIEFGELTEISTYEFYDGAYVITPLTTDQDLETELKVMRGDVTVLAVPYAEVDNVYGGVTVTIGM